MQGQITGDFSLPMPGENRSPCLRPGSTGHFALWLQSRNSDPMKPATGVLVDLRQIAECVTMYTLVRFHEEHRGNEQAHQCND
jgi:hypothetical protein